MHPNTKRTVLKMHAFGFNAATIASDLSLPLAAVRDCIRESKAVKRQVSQKKSQKKRRSPEEKKRRADAEVARFEREFRAGRVD